MTTTRTRPEKTPEEMVAGVSRQIDGLERRARNEDPWMVADMLALAAKLEAAAVRTVGDLRDRGYTWNDIGLSLGISALTAYKRYGKPGRQDAVSAAPEKSMS